MGLIFNKQRKYGEEECDILLTESDVKRGIYRAHRNQEDIPRKWYQFWR